MKEPYGEGVASHTGPESCAVARKGDGEALTGGRVGWVLSREIPRHVQGADAVEEAEGHTARVAIARRARTLRGRRPHARTDTPRHGNREIPRSPGDTADRIGKSQDTRR